MEYAIYAITTVLLSVSLIFILTNKEKLKDFFEDPAGVKKLSRNIDSKAQLLQGELHHSHKKVDALVNGLIKYEELYKDYKFHKLVTAALDEATPDMMWAKDIYGKYIIANKQIRDNLLFDERPYGKTDVQLALARKNTIGTRNHTFGEVCGNSDAAVLSEEKPMRFVEWGTVSGKLLVLEVHKNVIKDDFGNVIGTCGVARDITEEYTQLKDLAEETNCEDTKQKILMIIDKYKFENKEH